MRGYRQLMTGLTALGMDALVWTLASPQSETCQLVRTWNTEYMLYLRACMLHEKLRTRNTHSVTYRVVGAVPQCSLS